MSFKDCIQRAIDTGSIDESGGREAQQVFDDAYAQRRLDLGDLDAMAAARQDAIDEMQRIKAKQRQQKLLQAARAYDIQKQVKASGVPIERAMRAVMDFDPGVKNVANLSKRRDSWRGIFHSDMAKFLNEFRYDVLGRVRNKARLANVLRELHGEATGDEYAKELAESFAKTAERARKTFNRFGGDIPKLEKWALPHSHDSVAVRAAGFDEWFREIRQRVDLEQMKDYRTGKVMDEARFKLAAREAFDNISTEGWAVREANGAAYGQKLANRRTDHRFFIFKSADDWAAYHQKFGSGDEFSIMMGHLDGMARDIASLQILGPNPAATIRWMADVGEKSLRENAAATGARTDAPESVARSLRRDLNGMWEGFTGASNSPVNGRAARTFAGLRSVLQSAQLGGAALSAVTDLGFQKMAAGQVGIPLRNIVGRYASLLKPSNVEDRLLAVRLGLIAENWSSLASAQQRYLGEVSGPDITRRLADFTMRVSGLSPWTQAGRWAFGMEFSGLLADNAGKALNELPAPLQKTMSHYGISSVDWDVARKTPMLEHEGSTFLRPEDVQDEGVAMKLLDMLHTETEYAVPSASLRGRYALIGDNKPGTIQGELIRSVAMYKNFAVTLMMTHQRRIMSMPTLAQKGKYAAQLMLTMTAMGAFSMQMKEIVKGRDPRTAFSMDDPGAMGKFWGAAALQGGGMGIFGDFFFSQQNRYDKGLAETVAGPVVGAAGDFLGYLNDNVSRAAQGKETKVASGAIDLVQRYAPGGSLWYLSTGLQNLVFDELRQMADPETGDRLRRIEKRYKQETGQDYWYSRSRGLQRAPDLGAVFGE